jgi:type II secretory pathway pseudopilin PulG
MNKKGFTLIEIIVLIVMAGILLPAIIVPFVAGVRGSGKPEMATTAMYLAHQRMEELMKFNYGKTPELDPTSPISLQNSPISGYQWGYEILYVSSIDLMAAGSVNPPDTKYKRIRVQVTDPESSTYEVYAVVTNFPL